ncbi:MAG: hypothetical protein LCH61_12695 [Proteobacteria bacterium]|nr:hypothetical protein [Pseudomonadota bacterium]
MHLGSLLARLEDDGDAPAFLAGLGDVLLLADITATAAKFGETAQEYVTGAVRRYAGQASSDDWLQLMTMMEKAVDPAQAAVSSMVGWALRVDRGECGNCGGH